MDNEVKGTGNSLNYKYRMHDPRVGRFFAVDPLTAKYPYYSPYQFSGNKVIQFIELEGLEESGSGSNSGNTKTDNKDEIPFPISSMSLSPNSKKEFLAHRIVYDRSPLLAYRAAYNGGNSIRHVAVLFSISKSPLTGNTILELNGPNQNHPTDDDKGDRGSERGAFRHALWSAQITIEFGSEKAKLVTDTHEVGSYYMYSHPKYKGGDTSQRTGFKKLEYADQVADELNNQIGRNYGENGKTALMKQTAIGIAMEFRDRGLYVVEQQKDNTYSVVKRKLSKNKFDMLMKRFKQLSNSAGSILENSNIEKIKFMDRRLNQDLRY